jgi:large subunit ribosomal protein L9
MQIILLEKVVNIGDLGEVVKVKQGYARNFLIPQGKAKRATPENLKLLEEKRSELERAAGEKLAKAQAQAEKLEGVTIQVTQKAGVDGRLFGSVTNVDIVEALQGLGHTVEKSMVRMPEGPLKHVGDFPLVIALHSDVAANITVSVLGDTTGNQAA